MPPPEWRRKWRLLRDVGIDRSYHPDRKEPSRHHVFMRPGSPVVEEGFLLRGVGRAWISEGLEGRIPAGLHFDGMAWALNTTPDT